MDYKIKSSKPIDSQTKKAINNSWKRGFEFFRDVTIKPFRVVVCHSLSEFKKEAKYYYDSFSTAVVLRNKTIVIKSPNLIEKEGKWKKSDFQDILTHEVVHYFWYSI